MKPQLLDLSVLPEKLRNNWIIYTVLRSDAQVKYAREEADSLMSAYGGLLNRAEEFERAALKWSKVNPFDPMWDAPWPDGADVYLGREALEEARELVAAPH